MPSYSNEYYYTHAILERLAIAGANINLPKYPNAYVAHASQVHLELSQYLTDAVEREMVNIWMELLSNRERTVELSYITIPETWWDHFKIVYSNKRWASWAFRWAKKAKVRKVSTMVEHLKYHLCPHLPFDSKDRHVQFVIAVKKENNK